MTYDKQKPNKGWCTCDNCYCLVSPCLRNKSIGDYQMTDNLGHISELREAEQSLYNIVRAYYKIKSVREQLEKSE